MQLSFVFCYTITNLYLIILTCSMDSLNRSFYINVEVYTNFLILPNLLRRFKNLCSYLVILFKLFFIPLLLSLSHLTFCPEYVINNNKCGVYRIHAHHYTILKCKINFNIILISFFLFQVRNQYNSPNFTRVFKTRRKVIDRS